MLLVLLPDCFTIIIAIAIDQFVHLYEEDCSHIQTQNYFYNWNAKWYSWVGKTLDIVASSMTYMYDINKTKNSILKIPWFHTPVSIFSRNGHDNMGNIYKWKLTTTKWFPIFGGIFLPIPRLTDLSSTISGKLTVKETLGDSFIYPKVRVRV